MPKHPTQPDSRPRPARLRSALLGALCVAAGAASALAQQSALKPPAPREDPSAPVVLTILLLVVLAGATLFVAVFPSKRGHQD